MGYLNSNFNKIEYNKEDKSVHIYGCSSCPFLEDNSYGSVIEDPSCLFDQYINVVNSYDGWSINTHKTFPSKCPLKDKDFQVVIER